MTYVICRVPINSSRKSLCSKQATEDVKGKKLCEKHALEANHKFATGYAPKWWSRVDAGGYTA